MSDLTLKDFEYIHRPFVEKYRATLAALGAAIKGHDWIAIKKAQDDFEATLANLLEIEGQIKAKLSS
jgi:hypothetical protein